MALPLDKLYGMAQEAHDVLSRTKSRDEVASPVDVNRMAGQFLELLSLLIGEAENAEVQEATASAEQSLNATFS